MVFIVTYQLKNKLKDYTPLYGFLKSYSNWAHYFDNVWFIYAPGKSEKILLNEILPYLDSSQDYLFISRMDLQNKYGWLPKRAWDWLRKYKTSTN